MEEMRDIVLVLVADQLATAFLRLSVGRLFSITRNGMPLTYPTMSHRLSVARASLDRQLRGHMEDVVLGLFPINEPEGIALRIPVDCLGDCRAEDERVVDILVSPLEPLQPVRRGLQAPHGFVSIGEIERILAPLVVEAVDAEKLLREDIVENDIAQPVAPQGECVSLRQRLDAFKQGIVLLRLLVGHRAWTSVRREIRARSRGERQAAMLLRGAVFRIHRWRSCVVNAIDFVQIEPVEYSPEFRGASEKSRFNTQLAFPRCLRFSISEHARFGLRPSESWQTGAHT